MINKERLAGITALTLFLIINYSFYHQKVELNLGSYDSIRYYYYVNEMLKEQEYQYYDNYSYGGSINTSAPVQNILILMLYNLFNFGLSLYDFMKYYAFIILAITAIILYFYIERKFSNLIAVTACFLLIFTEPINYFFEAGVIKHYQLLTLLLITGFCLIDYYNNKKIMITYGAVLILTSLESVITLSLLLTYMIIYEKKNKNYLITGVLLGATYWISLTLITGRLPLAPPELYSRINEFKQVGLTLITPLIAQAILITPLLNKLRRGKRKELFFIITVITLLLIGRFKDYYLLITVITITACYGINYSIRKHPIATITALMIIVPIHLYNYYTHTQTVFFERTSDELINAYSWIHDNTPNNSLIYDCINHGGEIMAYAGRANIGDNHFEYLGDEPLIILNEYIKVMTSTNHAESLKLINNRGADYVIIHLLDNDSCTYLSNETEKSFREALITEGIPELELVYNSSETNIYRIIK